LKFSCGISGPLFGCPLLAFLAADAMNLAEGRSFGRQLIAALALLHRPHVGSGQSQSVSMIGRDKIMVNSGLFSFTGSIGVDNVAVVGRFDSDGPFASAH
jgi:hypothetical protein